MGIHYNAGEKKTEGSYDEPDKCGYDKRIVKKADPVFQRTIDVIEPFTGFI